MSSLHCLDFAGHTLTYPDYLDVLPERKDADFLVAVNHKTNMSGIFSPDYLLEMGPDNIDEYFTPLCQEPISVIFTYSELTKDLLIHSGGELIRIPQQAQKEGTSYHDILNSSLIQTSCDYVWYAGSGLPSRRSIISAEFKLKHTRLTILSRGLDNGLVYERYDPDEEWPVVIPMAVDGKVEKVMGNRNSSLTVETKEGKRYSITLKSPLREITA